MKLVFTDAETLGNIKPDKFKELGDVKIYDFTNPQETLSRVKNADIVLTNKVVINKDIIDKSNIKMIQVLATGTNNIDTDYAKSKGITVKNVTDYSTNSVAQLTFATVLNIMNKLNYFDSYSKTEYHKSNTFTHIKDFHELNSKTWGIIGLGNIGKKVASIAEAFGCNVIYYSTSGKNNNEKYKRATLQEVLKSDIISIHAPLNKNTFNLLNSDNLNSIKKGAILVNMGRGGIVNENDLAKIIDKRGFFAAFDVFTKEPIDKNNPLLKVKNIILTPHIAWASLEAREKLINKAFENVKSFIKSYQKQ